MSAQNIIRTSTHWTVIRFAGGTTSLTYDLLTLTGGPTKGGPSSPREKVPCRAIMCLAKGAGTATAKCMKLGSSLTESLTLIDGVEYPIQVWKILAGSQFSELLILW